MRNAEPGGCVCVQGTGSELAGSQRRVWGRLKSGGKAGNLTSGGARRQSWLLCLTKAVLG